MIRRPEVNTVFTPRASSVNPDMYVPRPTLEKRLSRAIESGKNIIIFGESGNGKTWLYKARFDNQGIDYRIVDLATAMSSSFEQAFIQAMKNPDEWKIESKTQSSQGGISALVKVDESTTTQLTRNAEDPLIALGNDIRSKKGQPRFVVFDNLERATQSDAAIEKIGSLIVRLDNPRIADLNLRILLVGVTADIREFISKFENVNTVTNRISEIPEVQRLSDEESRTLIRRGIEKKLKIRIKIPNYIELVITSTNGTAEQVHALCFQIACEARENNWVLDEGTYAEAKRLWVEESLNAQVSMIEARLNKRETRVQRRNQTLYCLGQITEDSFRAAQIEDMIRTSFPHTAGGDALGVVQIVAQLAEGTNPVLRRSPTDSSFTFSHPKLRLAIRAMLKIDNAGDVARVSN